MHLLAFDLLPKPTERRLQSPGELLRDANAYLDLSQLDRADVGAMDARLVREVLLRQAQFQPALPHHHAEGNLDVLHGGQLRQLQTINLQTIL
jgi:hypothetical protein